jgi:hypothetical protein
MTKPKIERVAVCFNVLDSDQEKMHKWVTGKSNSSAYMKRLIQRDMEGGVYTPPSSQPALPQGDFDPGDFI